MTHTPTRAQILAWRQDERQRLLAARNALTHRDELTAAIEQRLDEQLGTVRGLTVGVYWPIKSEPNLRRWMQRLCDRGARCALPVVVERAAPLAFHAWSPGAAMARGFWGIPVPAEALPVQPDVLIAPMIGFDRQCYRLGYGGGYYDRTLASLSPRPRVLGVAFTVTELPTIHPLPHDIALSCVVTDSAMHLPPG